MNADMAASAVRSGEVLSPAIDKLDTGRPASSGPLFQRIVSALLLMPVVIAAIYFGGRYFAAMVAFISIIMIYEWTRMVERRELSASFYALSAGAALSLFAATSGEYYAAISICAVSGILAFVFGKRGKSGLGFWPAVAAPYLLAPSVALIWLRFETDDARLWTFILFSVVWAADTGAFIFGKLLGGPKISYALSPSKTWAGIGGGIAGGVLVAVVAFAIFEVAGWWLALIVGGLLGAMSVLGDLAESAIKRNFGVKDISGLIPGHGGALDRLDGMIFATIAMTSVMFVGMMLEKL